MNLKEEIEFYKIKWDFFITHSSKDENQALELYNLLIEKSSNVFLDKVSIRAGSRWDDVISSAQQESLITIVLVSSDFNSAFYAKDEVHTAISLTRTRPNSHRIIPVYLNDISEDADMIYGLRLIQGLSLSKNKDLANIAAILFRSLYQFKSSAETVLNAEKEPQHILLSFPTGPMVEANSISRSIIEIYSNLIKESEARLVVSEANSFRLAANPGIPYIISHNKIPSPDKISAFEYWMDVFDYARLQGPRMLAALLLVVPDDFFNEKAKNDRLQLLNILKHYK